MERGSLFGKKKHAQISSPIMSDESNAALSLLPMVLQSNSDTSRQNVKPTYHSLSIISSHGFFWHFLHLSHAALAAPSPIADLCSASSNPPCTSLLPSSNLPVAHRSCWYKPRQRGRGLRYRSSGRRPLPPLPLPDEQSEGH
jgi:hypothetical protein